MNVAGTLNIDLTRGHLYDLTVRGITKKFLVEGENGEWVAPSVQTYLLLVKGPLWKEYLGTAAGTISKAIKAQSSARKQIG
ncbi:MAG TPA: hypothetical protein VGO47_00740 [Chlamydiales bacterium]|jgi:hypothetical protein|nr:hypothetical protein [Chlamydiales bacterium]